MPWMIDLSWPVWRPLLAVRALVKLKLGRRNSMGGHFPAPGPAVLVQLAGYDLIPVQALVRFEQRRR
jgi:hypothetical protein